MADTDDIDDLPSLGRMWAEVRVLRHDLRNLETAVKGMPDLIHDLRRELIRVGDQSADLERTLFGHPGRHGDKGAFGKLEDIVHSVNRKLEQVLVRADELDRGATERERRLQWRLIGGLGTLLLAVVGDIVAHVGFHLG